MVHRLFLLLMTLHCTLATAQPSLVSKPSTDTAEFVTLRGRVQNSLLRFSKSRTGHVAFLGGSITEMNGYRPRICEWLQKRFPDTDFTFTDAGIASTCSNTGAFRLKRDVLSRGPVDLLFVEFAVNDDQDAMHNADGCVRGMEGIIRAVRRHNPGADIVMTHFVNPGMLETLAAGNDILSASQHEKVAEHYHVSSVYLSKVVAARIKAGTLRWDQFGGTHPGPIGNQLAADLAVSILDQGWSESAATEIQFIPHPLPAPILPSSFDNGTLLPLESVEIENAWTLSEPDWSKIAGSRRSRFVEVPLLHSETPSAALTFEFTGTAVGAFVVAGPDAGQLEFRIDGGSWQTVELFHRFSKGLHYPRTVMFASDLPANQHVVRVRLAKSHHPDSQGTAARVLHFVTNDRP
ncbi:MAG: SGNH/GDSL hydrolase family protein [Planctomycetaceae bacterium]